MLYRLLVFALLAARPLCAQQTLTKAKQVLDLGNAAASQMKSPVRLSGVVTLDHPVPPRRAQWLYVQDDTAGVFVRPNPMLETHLKPGTRVDVTGITLGALFAPSVAEATVTVTGTAPLPPPLQLPVERLAAGEAFGQWVEVDGSVRDAVVAGGELTLLVSRGGTHFRVTLPVTPDLPPVAQWRDTAIRAQGLNWTDNEVVRGDPGSFRVYAPGMSQVVVAGAGAARETFSATVMSKLAGGRLLLRTDKGGAIVQPAQLLPRTQPGAQGLNYAPSPAVQPGDKIAVAGVRLTGPVTPVFDDAFWLTAERGELDTPAAVTAVTLTGGDYDGQLVAVEGRLIERTLRRAGWFRHDVLVLVAGGTTFEAVLESAAGNKLSGLPLEDRVRVTGIVTRATSGTPPQERVRIYCRDPDDAKALGPAEPWLIRQGWKFAAGLAGLGLVASAWIWQLRQQVTARKQAEAGLRELNVQLEHRVTERTAELSAANEKLLRSEEELHRNLAREKELNELKSAFVSMVSHEFRTPLGIIMSSAEILERYFDRIDAADRREHLLSVARNARRMAGMMEEVLLLSRLDAGRMECKPAPLHLPGLCRRLVDEMHSATSRTCPIGFTCDGSAADEAHADESLLRHILTNLLSNAVKYSPDGTPVSLRLRRCGTDAIFEVEDHGIGIPQADHRHLFEAFHRGGNVAQRHGTGLGLVIVKRCLELHGGRIALESTEGAGTTFTIHLPVFP